MITINVYGVVQETKAAILYHLTDDHMNPETQWVPKSLIDDDDLDKHNNGTIEVPQWWAENEGLV